MTEFVHPEYTYSELDKAITYFANVYFAGVCGADWDEACDVAAKLADRLYDESGNEQVVADHLHIEAARYADM